MRETMKYPGLIILAFIVSVIAILFCLSYHGEAMFKIPRGVDLGVYFSHPDQIYVSWLYGWPLCYAAGPAKGANVLYLWLTGEFDVIPMIGNIFTGLLVGGGFALGAYAVRSHDTNEVIVIHEQFHKDR